MYLLEQIAAGRITRMGVSMSSLALTQGKTTLLAGEIQLSATAQACRIPPGRTTSSTAMVQVVSTAREATTCISPRLALAQRTIPSASGHREVDKISRTLPT